MSRIHALATAAALLLSAPLTPALAATKVFDLPNVVSSFVKTACGPNKVAGEVVTTEHGTTAFTYADKSGTVELYAVPGATYTSPYGCYRGRLMGRTIVNSTQQGFVVLPDGGVQLVAPADGTWATVTGTNSSGTLVGFYSPDDMGGWETAGFVLKKDGSFTRYVQPNYSFVQLVDIAEDGTLLGNRNVGNRTYGFIDRQGVIEEIKVPSSYTTIVTGMNADGHVVGHYYQSGSSKRGFVMKNGVYKVFSLTSTGNTFPMDIDKNGKVVGYFINTNDWTSHNFIGKVPGLVNP